MTIVVQEVDEDVIAQIVQQLYKLVDMIQVFDHTGDVVVERELAMMKIETSPETRQEILQLATVFRARTVDVGDDNIVLEVTGAPDKVEALERIMDPYGILEMVRTGKVIMTRGNQPT